MQILKQSTLEQLLQAEKVAIRYNARLALAISKEYNTRVLS